AFPVFSRNGGGLIIQSLDRKRGVSREAGDGVCTSKKVDDTSQHCRHENAGRSAFQEPITQTGLLA
ncbi:MAG: hypothetical protein SVR04_12895, partial [Spirochaetota bacterium]|nr:hypothetical protein [Spirochaetota bacterium]